MSEKNNKQPEKILYKGFCDKTCEFFIKENIPSFNNYPNNDIIELCSYGNCKRSFGCMAICPKIS